jgi:acetyl-CoA acetyltransferase
MTRFEKSESSLRQLAGMAAREALADAGVEVAAIEAAYVGNAAAGLVTGQEMIRGQVVLRPLGIEGIPIFNVENACASAASAPAELMVYEQVGFAAPNEGPALLESGRTRLGGAMPVNASGGLLSKGHPIGATGIAQICESTWQLRGEAGQRQVEGAKIALTQNGGGWLEGDSAAMAVHILSAN